MADPVARLLREVLLGMHKMPDGKPVPKEVIRALFAATKPGPTHG